jgi:hypothetical protein
VKILQKPISLLLLLLTIFNLTETYAQNVLQRPPEPPIDKKWIVKANKLALDYALNRSLADKKYKTNSRIIVEGTVKEIKKTGDDGITLIILSGSPSKIDAQCEFTNSRKIKNLKVGMKATLIAICDGLNGNVMLSRCIYIEKPNYQ